MKNLKDVQGDMSELYEGIKSGKTDLRVAKELNNTAGKFLKAEQLQLARDIFLSKIKPRRK